MIMTVETAQLNNQSILESFGLVEEIDEQAAEIISGGLERFSIRNETQKPIYYTLDGVRAVIKPGENHRIRTDLGGDIRFDGDSRDEVVRPKVYDLRDSGKYVFYSNATNNSNRIELYRQV
ncbi:hypothetical protein IQ274_27850 [Nostoc sp. LEGE 12447]|uniref:hypothetical protein n=1 Tax=Nostoc sp. LEGE 12447 TaxID=1828640 RepID=UPI0018831772|nr:hypothetical protein [Nostoc sp. LEGE 12447]MBE9001911.1 hypothetical protein [Nostoc sp. LEGE 12447]